MVKHADLNGFTVKTLKIYSDYKSTNQRPPILPMGQDVPSILKAEECQSSRLVYEKEVSEMAYYLAVDDLFLKIT